MESKSLTEFQAWPKIPRYKQVMMHITEKIDGTNAQVIVLPREGAEIPSCAFWVSEDGMLAIAAASRSRFIQPGDDNYGFAAWVQKNAEELVKLGVGRHYGEWYGAGIQRRYGLDHKRFALFNERTEGFAPACCSVVPTLYFGPYDNAMVQQIDADLRTGGSVAVPGWMQPEGIVVRLVGAAPVQKITDLAQGSK